MIGGSGTSSDAPVLLSLATASEASNAVNLTLEAPLESNLIVGAPELIFTYAGCGTARFVQAQIVDGTTGLVLRNLVAPVPVTLDGQTHTTTVSLSTVAAGTVALASPGPGSH